MQEDVVLQDSVVDIVPSSSAPVASNDVVPIASEQAVSSITTSESRNQDLSVTGLAVIEVESCEDTEKEEVQLIDRRNAPIPPALDRTETSSSQIAATSVVEEEEVAGEVRSDSEQE